MREPDEENQNEVDEEILSRAEEAGRRGEAKEKQEDGVGVGSVTGERNKKRKKFEKLVNWGEEYSNHEEGSGGVEEWIGNYGTRTAGNRTCTTSPEMEDVTRDWLLEPARPQPCASLRQTRLVGVVERMAVSKSAGIGGIQEVEGRANN